ncbi:MAG TPA: hypothetical protein PK743_03115 [Luteimonas sp.]|nr:hypothetical protein [Luteimonas sp.]HRO27761.1 hypothetical protein [Luteimonas sp.]HRP71612.1 hypothetical protein [Luteimonas sp.]
MKHTQPSFEDLLDPLYGSLLDPARSEEFGKKLALAMNAHLVALQVDDGCHRHDISKHLAEGRADAPARDRDDATINQLVLKDRDRLIRDGFGSSTGMFASGELERTAFYHEVMVRYDVLHGASILLHRESSGSITSLTVNRDRHRPPFGDLEDSLLKRLLPHLRNVHALQQRLQIAWQLSHGLDHVAAGVWLLDAQGDIVHANLSAEGMLEDGNCGLGRQRNQLTAHCRADRQGLRQAILAATHGKTGQHQKVLLHARDGRFCSTCTVHPLTCGSLDGWMLSEQPAALVFVSLLASSAQVPADTLRQAFNLTSAEALLAQALLRHRSLAACRDALGKSHETLRTQLKALFAKTGTRQQSELVQLLQRVAG